MNIAKELDRIIRQEALTPLFQPIILCRQQTVYGYEALIRGPSNSPLHAPFSLFEAAAREDRLAELDLLCRRTILQQFAELNLPGHLFINVNPESMESIGFRRGQTLQFLDQLGVSPQRIVIELTERQPINNYQAMRTAVEHYRSMGFTIAIDDLGAGYSSLRHWSELRPDFVKIDRHFIEGIGDDSVKREFVRSILDIAQGVGTRVIAEGIETLEEYRCLWTMGVHHGQGYYFARPSGNPSQFITTVLPNIDSAAVTFSGGLRETAASIVSQVPIVDPDVSTDSVAKLFRDNATLEAVIIVDEHQRP